LTARITSLLSVFALITACAPRPEGPSLRLVAVRHAEKAEGDDPPLKPEGEARAMALADLLQGLPLTAVYSTDTRRTRDTARPTAEAHGLPVTTYAPADQGPLALRLRDEGGVVLVVGHSNTVPGFVEALGGPPAQDIPHEEYDRYYQVEAADGRPTVVQVLRYGAR